MNSNLQVNLQYDIVQEQMADNKLELGFRLESAAIHALDEKESCRAMNLLYKILKEALPDYHVFNQCQNCGNSFIKVQIDQDESVNCGYCLGQES